MTSHDSMPPAQHSNSGKRTRSGCYTCKVRKVKCKSKSQNRTADCDKQYRCDCDCCSRLGLKCRWTTPVAGEDYTPPPKRRLAIGRRRGRSHNSSQNRASIERIDSTYAMEDPQARRPQEDPIGDADLSEHSEQVSSRLAQPASFELDAYVDMLGDLPFHTDFTSDMGPVGLNFDGDGLSFAPSPTFDNLFPLSASGPIDSMDLSNRTDAGTLRSSHSLQRPDNTQSYGSEITSNASMSWDISDLGADEHYLMQHYLATMTGYAKVDDHPRNGSANNLYTSAFSQSLSFKPLLYAILAFSASHLALENDSYFQKASEYEQLARDSFDASKKDAAEPDCLLSALFVRAKRLHLIAGDIESFHGLITEATQIILSENGQRALKDPFSLAQGIAIRLALLDARASCYRLGGGTLIRALRRIPAMSYIFKPETNDSLAPNALVSLLRADILRMKVSELDLRLRFQADSEEPVSSPVRTEEIHSLHKHIEHEIRQWECQMSSRGHDLDDFVLAECVLDASTYAQYLIVVALHSSILYLYILYPLPSMQRERSVARIIHCQLRLQRDPSRTNSPSSLIPSSLFLAGVCTLDPIHWDWILERLTNGKRWGIYLERARQLLVAVMRTRSSGDRIEICNLMDQLDGRFLI